MELLGHEPVSTWDAGIAGGGLTCYATTPAPAGYLMLIFVPLTLYEYVPVLFTSRTFLTLLFEQLEVCLIQYYGFATWRLLT